MLFVFLLFVFGIGVHGQYNEGAAYIPVQFPTDPWPNCTFSPKAHGACEKIVDCPHAIHAIILGLHPPVCYWERHATFPLVCCPLLQDPLPENLIPSVPQEDFSGAFPSRYRCGDVKQFETPLRETENEYTGESSSYRETKKLKKYPWMVSIYSDKEGKNFVYSGFIIDEMNVVTSAQNLVDDPNTVAYTVRLGGPNDNGPLYDIARCKIHGGYRTWVKYDDIAVLRLEEPITDPHVPICLPTSRLKSDTLAGLNATVTSFNQVEKIPIVNHAWCEEVYSKFSPLAYPRGVSNQFICAGLQLANSPNSHQTDVGTPLALQDDNGRWTAIGMVSHDYKDAKQGFPGVYINMAHYSNWIEKERTVIPYYKG